MPKTLLEYKDFEIKTIFNEIYSDLQLSYPRKEHKDFCSHYVNRTTDEVSWLQVCSEVKSLKCFKFSLMFICKLLNKKLYVGDNSTYLYNLLPFINIIVKDCSSRIAYVMCGDRVKDLIIYKRIVKSGGLFYIILTSRNMFIKSLASDFLYTLRKHMGWNNAKVFEVFELSLGIYIDKINSYKDFNDHTFWEQINFYKNYFKDDKVQLNYSIICICTYYRWLVNTYSEYNFFESSFTMTEQLLFSSILTELIRTDYYFTSFNPNNHPKDKNRICFILRGFENLSTRITNESYFIVDTSNINNSFYSKTFISYILSFQNISTITNQKNYICVFLEFILKMKLQKNYPNKTLDYMTNQEAVLIRNFFYDKNLELGTLNNKVGTIRRFLLWCQDSNKIRFDDMFFSYLSQYEEPSYTTGESIPDDKLILLNNYISNDAKQSHIAKLSYVIFHLLIQTEFRISQICNLTINCIKPTIKPNQFIIHTNSKTSNGLKNEFVITDLTYHLLMNVIEDTEVYRTKCNIDSYKNYIFLFDGRYSSILVMNSLKFYSYMRSVCKALNFEKTYSASNLRDTWTYVNILDTKSRTFLSCIPG